LKWISAYICVGINQHKIKAISKMNQQGQTRYFYKGTCFPIPLPAADQELLMKCAKDMIAAGLRDGDTMKSLATLFKAQLDEIIEKLVELEKENGNCECSREDLVLLAASEPFDMELENMVTLWTLNVCALLIMKEIEDDEMNGVLTNYKKGNTLFCEMGRDPRAAAAQEPAPKPKKNKKKKIRIVRSKGLSKRTHR
jgi:uncharacterized protein (UPF0335 family)